jgi:uncharacterized membrane protein YkvA (DUF1232 family)
MFNMTAPYDSSPTGLSRQQHQQLDVYVQQAAHLTVVELRQAVAQHLEATAAVHAQNPMVNLRLATAIRDVIEQVLSAWDDLPPAARAWLAGAILYFAKNNDDEPDFTSPIGFEDDAEVLNACLRLAKLGALCLHPEDYDDV